MNYNIQCYAAMDRAAVLSVIDAVCREGLWMRTPRYEPTPVWELALSGAPAPGHLLRVVTAEARVIGWLRAFPVNHSEQVELGMGVLLPFRNGGIGTRLVAGALEWAGAAGYTRVSAVCRRDNTRAWHLFSKAGFSSLGWTTSQWGELMLALPQRHGWPQEEGRVCVL